MKLKINNTKRERYFNCNYLIFNNIIELSVLYRFKNFKDHLIKLLLLIMTNEKCVENTELLGKYFHTVNRKN